MDQALKRRGFNAAEVRSGKRPKTMTGAEALAKLQRSPELRVNVTAPGGRSRSW
jgi:hypothetical protein